MFLCLAIMEGVIVQMFLADKCIAQDNTSLKVSVDMQPQSEMNDSEIYQDFNEGEHSGGIAQNIVEVIWSCIRWLLSPVLDIGPLRTAYKGQKPFVNSEEHERYHYQSHSLADSRNLRTDAGKAGNLVSALNYGYIQHKCKDVDFLSMSEEEAKVFVKNSLQDTQPPMPPPRPKLQRKLSRERRMHLGFAPMPTDNSMSTCSDLQKHQHKKKRLLNVNYL